jgi:DNA-binding transcriptional MerR regulator
MSKDADAFRTISEVADDLDVPKHVLRFWEVRFPQVRPMKRGGGRRYYRPEDLELLRGIHRLLHAEGYTIKGVQKILREQGIEHVKTYARAATTERQAAAERRRAGAEAKPRRESRGRATPAARSLGSRNALIDRMLAELDACRRLLLEGAAASERPAGRRRSA